MGPPHVWSTGCSKAACAGVCAGATQHLCELARLWRAHTKVITEIDHAQKSLITESDSCSLLRIFLFAQNSFMFSAPVFSAKSFIALLPTTESQTCPAHQEVLPSCTTPSLSSLTNTFPSSPLLGTASPWGALGKPKQLRGSQGDTTRAEFIAEPHRPLFQLAQPSYPLLPMPA